MTTMSPLMTTMPRSSPPSLSALSQVFQSRGNGQYTGEPVTHLAHALQTAHLARRAGAGDALVVAALLHDIGHLVSGHSGTPTLDGIDDRHEHTGADLLACWFGEDVTGPVRLHVQAKRCLAANPAYWRALSEDSRRSLLLQGGPMDKGEVAVFRVSPWAMEALMLRRWDEAAKNPLWKVGELAEIWPLVTSLVQRQECRPDLRLDQSPAQV
jgi:phosphonate degradation associated HDIG domain protein